MRSLALAALVLAAPAQAATIVLDFEEEVGAGHFTSSQCGCVTFDGQGGTPLEDDIFLSVSDLGEATDGRGLVLEWHTLEIVFAEPVTELSLDFGLDDPYYWEPGAEAVLRGGAESARVALNRDGVMNQSISISGAPFERAYFHFSGEAQPEPAFTVDNLRFETVPEPGTLGLGALVLAAALTRRWAGSPGSTPPSQSHR